MKDKFENIFFQYGLYLAVVYQVYQTFNGYVSGATTLPFNVGILIGLLVVVFLSWKLKDINYLAFFLHLVMLPVLVYFWMSFGGLSGTVPLILFVYTNWTIFSLRGWQQIITLGIYFLVFIGLSELPAIAETFNATPTQLSTFQLSIDFLVIAVIITFFLVYLKTKFATYRNRIAHRHKQLQKLSVTVHSQTDKLLTAQEEVKSINENLELIIDQRIQKIEARNKELEEYAFINAHLVRGPLCRIIGLSNLMLEEGDYPKLEIIRQKAQQVDFITRKINAHISQH